MKTRDHGGLRRVTMAMVWPGAAAIEQADSGGWPRRNVPRDEAERRIPAGRREPCKWLRAGPMEIVIMSAGVIAFGIARRSANAADVCGDMADWWSRDGKELVAIADGLGHGREAAVAAAAALEAVAAWQGDNLVDLFYSMNVALRPTRGAAVGVATVDWATGLITYAAVGNTRAALFGERIIRMDGYAGIVGGGYQRLTPVTLPFMSGDVMALWTDGLDEQLELGPADHSAPGMDGMAAGLLDRFARGHDDRCVVVARLVQG
jgi:negative regulator of sigma-B (phosphoserine phosphatase)